MAPKIKNPRQLIKSSAVALEQVMLIELASIGDAMIKQLLGRARVLSPNQKLKGLKELKWPGEAAYLGKLREAMAVVALDALKQARQDLPQGSRRLSEEIDSVKLADTSLLDSLPKEVRTRIQKRSALLVGKQLSDLDSALMFQYANSAETTDDGDLLRGDLQEAAGEYITGSRISAGSVLAASQVVNDSRSAFFFDEDSLDQVDAFVFVNGDPVTDICQDLNGTVFAKDDPEMFRYTPPLHWNCKSYIAPIPAGKLGDREITRLKPSTKKLEDSIQFSESFTCSCQEKN